MVWDMCFGFQGGSDKPQIVFEEQWPKMQPSIVKLLRQESINRSEWQDLFYSIHQVCSWDEKAAAKIYKALQDNILEFIRQAQQVRKSSKPMNLIASEFS